MKRILTAVIFIICIRGLQSCAVTKSNPIRGKYIDTVFVFNSAKSKGQVWDNIVDVVASTGMKFKTLDKENGLLVSEEYSFEGSITFEDINGNLRDPNAWIVVNSQYWKASKEYVYPKLVSGILTVRVKEDATGSTGSINLTNLKAYDDAFGKRVYREGVQIKSTGVFEKKLADKLK